MNTVAAPAANTSGLVKNLPEVVLAGVPTILILLEIWVFDPGDEVIRSFAGLAAGGSLLWIRRRPFAAYLINGFAVYALIGLGYPSDFYQWSNMVALFVVASRVRNREAIVALLLGWLGVILYFVRFPQEGGFVLASAVIAIWTTAWFGGRAQYARVRELDLKRERDITLADLAAQQARAELDLERQRIARDLHDIIGHAVNVMVVHAGAGQVNTQSGSETRTAFDVIASTGRAALADLDRMLDVLQGAPERSPLPGMSQLEQLCKGVGSPSLAVALTIEGNLAKVPSSLGVAAYRIIQEALTNVIKHAGAARVIVNVEVDEALTITVADDGAGSKAMAGRGLTGISERVALHRGAVTYGPGQSGGFQVACRFPLITDE